MHLRPFRPDDLQTLYEIDQACFVPGISYSQKELAAFIGHRHSQTWIAEEAGKITGFLIANREPRKILHIVTIDVLKAWRRRGVGSLLMDAAEQWAGDHGLRLIGLETAQDNFAAQRFYEARGYRKVDEIARYYADGTSAWVMMKELD
ncbi:MAG: GNAT family N-acetyltransferase [Terriglobia bacterium]|jgi:ribosomal-protein-alanine N-acetyltransferase